MGLAKIRPAEDFSYEGVREWNFKAENTRNSHNFVKCMDLVVTWPNRLLSGKFRGKVVIIWSILWVLWLLGQIISFMENFVYFVENANLCLWV